MARGPVRRSNLIRDTLLAIAAMGVITVAAALSPAILQAIAKICFKETGERSYARIRALRNIRNRKLLSFKELGNGQIRIELSQNGKKLVRSYNIDNIKLVLPKRWDGFWHVVIYDIPASQKRASYAFQSKIRQLGLFPLQKSVWVSPYECLAELEFLAEVFGINFQQCVSYFKTKDIPKETEIKRAFGL